jgi:hypothetical protein
MAGPSAANGVRVRVVPVTEQRLSVGSLESPAPYVARAKRGYSVVVARAGRGAFFEVETEADARRLLRMVGVSWPR